jgi:hypothetical protein
MTNKELNKEIQEKLKKAFKIYMPHNMACIYDELENVCEDEDLQNLCELDKDFIRAFEEMFCEDKPFLSWSINIREKES